MEEKQDVECKDNDAGKHAAAVHVTTVRGARRSFGLTVRAIVCDEQGRCLLLRRVATSAHFPGCWEWPGGKVDMGEDIEVALEREFFEETGLTISCVRFAGATAFDVMDLHVIVLCMDAGVTEGTLRLSAEHDAVEWVPFAAFEHWHFPEPMRDFMVAYSHRRINGRPEVF